MAGYAVGRGSGLPAFVTCPETLIRVALSVGFAVGGALIIAQYPRHRPGWLDIGNATTISAALTAFPCARYGLVTAPGFRTPLLASGAIPNIYIKLHVANHSAAIMWAREAGLGVHGGVP